MAKRPLEFIRFCLVGAVNTGVDLTVFTVLSNLGVLLLAAQSISYTCGVLNSFLLNRTWTFQGRSHQSRGQLIRFLALNLGTLTITSGLLVYFHNHFAWPLLVCKLIATGASLGINYFGSRLWIFNSISESNEVV
ncbi:MAG: GtrA family protein [Desulfosporosinus sp.]|nr:GtrA family protein [Desulfosporosinus sp.]